MLKEMHIMESNVFGFQKEPMLPLKDPRSFGYLKLKNIFCRDGCSRHMTVNYSWFSSFTKIKNDGNVSFGDNSKGKIIDIDNVGNVSFTLIENVCFFC